jgi:hypothetical protein
MSTQLKMTQTEWDKLTPHQQAQQRDNSNIHPQLLKFLHRKVQVEPKRSSGLSTFKVGRSTGWEPVLLAVKGNKDGSSDLINRDEVFTSITVVK